MFKILIVEDDLNQAELYESYLSSAGYESDIATDGYKALDMIGEEVYDLIITDVMMPNMDGFELTKSIREAGYNIPIIMITVKDSFDDVKYGFKVGVDDYMMKPINLEEMLLRVEAVLRRARIASQNTLKVGETILDYEKLTLSRDGETYNLPQKEFQVIFKLLSYPNRIFTRQELMDEFWGLDSKTDIRTIDVHIKRLRDKLINNPDFNIITVRGLGYKATINHGKED